MPSLLASYVTSIESQRYYKQVRYYWTVCLAGKPDELVAWGHAPRKEQAEAAARIEIEGLRAGFSSGGHVTSPNVVRHILA